MKKRAIEKASNPPARIPLSLATRKEREAFTAAVRTADEQCEKLGLADPTETEPALLYSPFGGRK